MEIAGFEIPSKSPVFLAVLPIHVPIGLLAVVAGAAAMLAEKRRGRRIKAGSLYFWSIAALFGTSTALAAMRWADDYHLFALWGRWRLSLRRLVVESGAIDGKLRSIYTSLGWALLYFDDHRILR